jgi:miniconductance mechanosensitive channel
MTNLGTFRAYALAYLKSHPDIAPNMTCMVRQMAAGAEGVPMEIYCFTRTTAWVEYERIQGDIFDYLLAVLAEFGLRVFQQPSGADMRAGLAGDASPLSQDHRSLSPLHRARDSL